jgi:aspartyl-tRNA(Asn)/glutamyl-tRNA(Gln) amidotransferase subunit A
MSTPSELAALAARLGFRLDDEQVADMHAAVLAAEPAVARLRTRLDAVVLDPAHGDRWLRWPPLESR